MKYSYVIYADSLKLFQEHRDCLFAVDIPDAMAKYDEMVKRYNEKAGQGYLTCAEMGLTEETFLEESACFDTIYVEPLPDWIENYNNEGQA